VGGSLTFVGASLCLRWYTFWRRNYRGSLLTNGPYSWVRHPFYSGFLALTLGLAILIPIVETVMLSVFSIAVILFYIKREEEFLLERYGKTYRDYMRRVPWKLIPRVY
jgi:protein-S-isoprenylcysteine O-methyltransferase Ste14